MNRIKLKKLIKALETPLPSNHQLDMAYRWLSEEKENNICKTYYCAAGLFTIAYPKSKLIFNRESESIEIKGGEYTCRSHDNLAKYFEISDNQEFQIFNSLSYDGTTRNDAKKVIKRIKMILNGKIK